MYHAQVNLYFLVLLLVFRAQRTTNAKKKKTKISTKRTSEISNALRFT